MQKPPPPPVPAPPLAPAPAPVDLSGIERQLDNLTSQMEALRRPDHLDHSIATFREELAEIRHSLTEALPRQAIDSLETEIRALGQKIERSRESGGDRETLGGIERALNEIYSAVRALTPAEQLAGYDGAIRIPISSSSSRPRSQRCATSRPKSPPTMRSGIWAITSVRSAKSSITFHKAAATTCSRRWSSASHC